MKGQKTTARLSISGVFRSGRRFRLRHLVDTGTPEEIDAKIQKIRTSIFTGVGQKAVFVLGIHVLDLEQVCSASVLLEGYGERAIKVR